MYVDPGINTSASNLKWVLPYCKPDLPRVVGALLLFIANNTMALTIPILSGIIVDRVIVGGHADELPRLCGLMILMTIIRVGARYGYQMWMERFGQNSVYRLVSDEYEKLHELDFTYFNHTRTGDIMSRLTSDTDAIRHCLSWVSYQIADCVVMFVGALCVMFAIDWRLALVLACVTPFIFVLTRGLSTHAHPLFFAIRNSLASLNSMVEENIEGNRVVKAFVREPYETEKFDEHNDDYMQCNMALAYNSRKYMPWLDGLGFSLQLITLGLGGFLVIKGYMTLGNLVSFNSFLWMIDGPVRQSGWLINDWQRFNASCIKIRKLLTEQPRIVEKPDAVEAVKQAVTIVEQVKHDDEATGATGAPVASGTSGAQQSTERKSCPLHIKGDIRFDHVSFAFPDDPETPILKDLDFTVPAGSKLGILGETGAGKSTALALLAMQMRRYENASIFVFDKGMSMYATTKACRGQHFNIAGEKNGLQFAPLYALGTKQDRTWALDWIDTILKLNGVNSTPGDRYKIANTLKLMDKEGKRQLSDFVGLINVPHIKEALLPYTDSMLLNAKEDTFALSSFTTFEMEELMGLGERWALPILLYLFRRIEKSLHGQPAFIILDEAWLMLAHPAFREKITEWLRVLRKANCALLMATQNISDAVDSPIWNVLLSQTATKIFLPNFQANDMAETYANMGLNPHQINIIARAVAKRQYYLVSENGCRLFNFALGPLALAFAGASDKETVQTIQNLE